MAGTRRPFPRHTRDRDCCSPEMTAHDARAGIARWLIMEKIGRVATNATMCSRGTAVGRAEARGIAPRLGVRRGPRILYDAQAARDGAFERLYQFTCQHNWKFSSSRSDLRRPARRFAWQTQLARGRPFRLSVIPFSVGCYAPPHSLDYLIDDTPNRVDVLSIVHARHPSRGRRRSIAETARGSRIAPRQHHDCSTAIRLQRAHQSLTVEKLENCRRKVVGPPDGGPTRCRLNVARAGPVLRGDAYLFCDRLS